MEDNTENKIWYALRVTYCRELIVKKHLDAVEIENYLPMCIVEKPYGAIKRRVEVPLIRNLIFLYATEDVVKHLKATTLLPIQYIMDRATKSPVIVPDEQMQSFIVATQNGGAEMIDPAAAALSGGDLVRVMKGPFAGIEGRYIRQNGHGKVAVEIRGIATVLTACISLREIEKITNTK